MTEPEYLTVEEIAARLRLSRMTVYRLIRSGELPASMFGRSMRVKAVDLAAYIEASAVTEGGQP